MPNNAKTDRLNRAARLACLAALLQSRKPGRPPKHEFDTAELAVRFGASQRTIQRDLHDAWRVVELMEEFNKIS